MLLNRPLNNSAQIVQAIPLRAGFDSNWLVVTIYKPKGVFASVEFQK